MAVDRAASGVSRMALESASSAGSQGSGAGSGAGSGMIASWKTAFRAASDAVVGLPPREVRFRLLWRGYAKSVVAVIVALPLR
jgi:hypothetical protein